jgi:hypothetical protein
LEVSKRDQFYSPLVNFMSDGEEFSVPLDLIRDDPDSEPSAAVSNLFSSSSCQLYEDP